MPYGDANAIVVEMANEVLPVIKQLGACRRKRHRPFPRHERFPSIS